jgi:hypothetical protein
LRLISIVVALILLGWLFLYLAVPKEPHYQGRTLTQWLEDYPKLATFTGSIESRDAKIKECEQALKGMGDDAIPSLLNMLRVRNTPLKIRLASLMSHQSFIRFPLPNVTLEHYYAFIGFAILGTNAQSAAPALANVMKSPDPEVRIDAIQCLLFTQPSRELLLPVLLNGLQDSQSFVRATSASHLSIHFPDEAEKAGVYKLYPGLKVHKMTAFDGETGKFVPLN